MKTYIMFNQMFSNYVKLYNSQNGKKFCKNITPVIFNRAFLQINALLLQGIGYKFR